LSCRLKLREYLGLYAVTADYGVRTHTAIARAAVEGGARVIQYREKGASSREMLQTALELRELTAASGAIFIVNDRIDIAQAAYADGVHLGQDDMPYSVARGILGDGYIIGISATDYREAVEAAREGADYIGLGPIYPTPSKDDAAPAIGIEGLSAVVQAVDVPVVAIGGLTTDNIEEVIRAGADAAAVISAIAAAGDMADATRLLNGMITRCKSEYKI